MVKIDSIYIQIVRPIMIVLALIFLTIYFLYLSLTWKPSAKLTGILPGNIEKVIEYNKINPNTGALCEKKVDGQGFDFNANTDFSKPCANDLTYSLWLYLEEIDQEENTNSKVDKPNILIKSKSPDKYSNIFTIGLIPNTNNLEINIEMQNINRDPNNGPIIQGYNQNLKDDRHCELELSTYNGAEMKIKSPCLNDNLVNNKDNKNKIPDCKKNNKKNCPNEDPYKCYDLSHKCSSIISGYKKFKVELENVPIREWFNIIITTHRTILEIYLNGKLYKTKIMPAYPKIDNGSNIYLAPNGGIDGKIAKLEYYPNYIISSRAQYIFNKGYTDYLGFLDKYKINFEIDKGMEKIASYAI